MTFSELQTEVGTWSERNFGAQDPINPLLGVIEELGEICQLKQSIRPMVHGLHLPQATDGVAGLIAMMAEIGEVARAILKRRQGIRGTREEHIKREIEALVALANVAGDRRMCLYDAIDAGATTRARQASVTEDVDWTPMTDTQAEEERDGIADLQIFLADYCHRNHHDQQGIIEDVWGMVKERDWKKNPDNGKGSEG